MFFGKLFFAVAPFLNNLLLLADHTLSGIVSIFNNQPILILANRHIFFPRSSMLRQRYLNKSSTCDTFSVKIFWKYVDLGRTSIKVD
jgi:hypothetical protein